MKIAPKGRRLTPEQQDLVMSVEPLIVWFVGRIPAALATSIGWDDVRQEMFVAVCHAAAVFDPSMGYKFNGFACKWMQKHLLGARAKRFRNARAWHSDVEVPLDDRGGDAVMLTEQVPARECDGRHELFSWWHSEDARRARRSLHALDRLVLYLRIVEALSFEELGQTFGVSKQRMQQLESRARERVAEYRFRPQNRVTSADKKRMSEQARSPNEARRD